MLVGQNPVCIASWAPLGLVPAAACPTVATKMKFPPLLAPPPPAIAVEERSNPLLFRGSKATASKKRQLKGVDLRWEFFMPLGFDFALNKRR
jgi:hypothetical protein